MSIAEIAGAAVTQERRIVTAIPGEKALQSSSETIIRKRSRMPAAALDDVSGMISRNSSPP